MTCWSWDTRSPRLEQRLGMEGSIARKRFERRVRRLRDQIEKEVGEAAAASDFPGVDGC